ARRTRSTASAGTLDDAATSSTVRCSPGRMSCSKPCSTRPPSRTELTSASTEMPRATRSSRSARCSAASSPAGSYTPAAASRSRSAGVIRRRHASVRSARQGSAPWRSERSALVGEDRDAGDRGRTTEVVREPDLRPLHLALAGLAAQLGGELVDHSHAGRAHGVAIGLEASRDVHRLLPPERGPAFLDEPAALPPAAEAEVLVVQDLRDGEAVVHLGEVH